jgi:hypothetical protein
MGQRQREAQMGRRDSWRWAETWVQAGTREQRLYDTQKLTGVQTKPRLPHGRGRACGCRASPVSPSSRCHGDGRKWKRQDPQGTGCARVGMAGLCPPSPASPGTHLQPGPLLRSPGPSHHLGQASMVLALSSRGSGTVGWRSEGSKK